MKTLYVREAAKNADALQIEVVDRPKPDVKTGECLVQVCSSAVNQSDAKATLGFFAHAKWPRIPGRDFAGVVVEGKGVGKKVWGTGGAAGIDFDGTHAEYLVIPEKAAVEIPKGMSIIDAGAQTLPYVTAYYGLVSRARIQAGERVLVLGALGQVGQAAMAICRWKGCKPVALVRENRMGEAKSLGWEAASSISDDFDVIFNPLGDLYWDESMRRLKKWGRMIIIGAGPDPKKSVALPLLPFYRANQDLIGINTVDLDFQQNGQLLSEMTEGFESGALTPLAVSGTFPIEKATEAYRAVLNHSATLRPVILFRN
jgi:NADPH:quinone reductase-like Zn-dependent oxidoreductase